MSHDLLVQRLRARRPFSLMLYDGAALAFSYLFFAVLRYGTLSGEDVALHLLLITVASIALQWTVGSAVRVYQGRTTVASLEETVLLGAVTVSTDLALGVLNMVSEPHFVARSVPLGATFMALFIMILGRAVWRRHREQQAYLNSGDAEPTLIFGAGTGGHQLVRSMRATPSSGMRPVGLLDDDPWKRRLRVDGIAVLGSRLDIASVAARTGASVLVIAIPSAEPSLIRDVSADAREAGLEVKVLPGVADLFSQRASIRDVRDINIHDLLGRGVIETDVDAIAGYLTGRRVLVTGAGGSIGSELCRQIHKWGPAELIKLDRDESALHAVQLSIHGQALLDSTDVVLADIRDVFALNEIFRDRRPEVVFHAAALKHLPMLEQYPNEAMKTNVLGTINVLRASAMVGVERFVNISTDKAADPISVLGYSKRVAERLTAAAASDTAGTYLSVRFGNVLGSRGSVLTTFAAQIAAGGPVTVTHPEVSRYFMTVEEAVQLVIQAAAIGRDAEALVLDMGEPVRIEDVARQLIEQSGENIEIIYTGLRDGEKMHEQLFGETEIDERPCHPLVSHVSVPEISHRRVLAAPSDLPRDETLETLLEWCAASDAALQSEPAFGPGEWSSIRP